MNSLRRSSFSVLAPPAVALAALSCGSGQAARAVQPEAPTAHQAIDTGRPACEKPDDPDQPLVVDMPAEQRADLEIAMRNQIAVVAYDCKSMKILRDCHVPGDYGFFGTTLQEKTVRLTSADEIAVNLPLSGVGIIARLGGELKSGSTLDLALLMVGARRTTWNQVRPSDLKGVCGGATHFVFGAYVGAFAMQQGAEGSAATTASIFGAGGSASSASSKSTTMKAGDADACNKADPSASEPPGRCAVAIRLELLPIRAGTTEHADDAPHPAASLASDACPSGYLLTEGKCAKPGGTKPHRCDGKDAVDCAKQCEAGDGPSCGVVASLYRVGQAGVPKDAAKAWPFAKKGCDLKDPTACFWQAGMMTHGEGTTKDLDGGVALLKQACTMGSAVACHDAGVSFINHQPASWKDAATWFVRGCDGGDQRSCDSVGRCFFLGGGACGDIPKDQPRANNVWRRACDGNVGASCGRLGQSLETGSGVARDAAAAASYYRKGCELGDKQACLYMGELFEKGDPAVPADRAQAVLFFEKALPDGGAAIHYGLALVAGTTIPADKAKGVGLLRGQCKHEKKYDGKSKPGCDALTKMGEKDE